MKKIAWLAATLVALYAWLDFLWPPVNRYLEKSPHSFWIVASDLLAIRSPIYPDVPFAGWLFLLVALLPIFATAKLIVMAGRYVINALESISVLETEFFVTMSDDMKQAVTKKKQLLIANKKGINAYEWASSASSWSGEVVNDSARCSSIVDNSSITDQVLTTYSLRRVDCVEIFKSALPVSITATLIPNRVLLWLYKTQGLFSAYIVKRTSESSFLNEYSTQEGDFRVSFNLAFKQSVLIRIVIDFPTSAAPPAASLRAFLFRENYARAIYVEQSSDSTRTRYEVVLRQLPPGSALRILWRNQI